jgi:MFS family permease
MGSTEGRPVTIVLLAITQFLVATDFDIVFVALPQIGRALGFDPRSLQWVVSAYTVTLGGFLLLGGRAADRLGARRVFVAGLVLFGLSSLAGGLATDPAALVAARAAQGLGAALLMPSSLKLLAAGFAEGPERNRAFAVWGVAGSTGAAVGALGGGVLTSAFGWAAVLLVNVPVTVLAAVAAPLVLPPDGPPVRGPFDLPGALLATLGSSLLVFGLVDGSWVVAGVGVLGLAGFAVVEHRSSAPLLPLRFLARRALVLPTVVVFLFMGAVGSAYYLITTYLQDVLGYPALQAGLAFLPLSLLSMVGAGLLFPALAGRWGVERTLVIGMAGLGVSLGGLTAGVSVGGSYWALLPGMVWALFAGVAFPAIFRAAGAAVGAGEQGVAAALVSTAQYIGGAVGLAALLAVSGLDAAGAAPALVDALRMTGAGAAGLALLGGAFAAGSVLVGVRRGRDDVDRAHRHRRHVVLRRCRSRAGPSRNARDPPILTGRVALSSEPVDESATRSPGWWTAGW